jgi:Ca2+/H+ antiporter, TMEM165/GDT1 family
MIDTASWQALLTCTGLVALAEMGDKTQLLALTLAARFRKPWPIVAGIAVATVLNHALAGWLGALAGRWAHALGPQMVPTMLGLGFVAMGVWLLVPDRSEEGPRWGERLGVFGATCVAFFILEMGDKTQIATVALAARFEGALVAVVMGTTLGMLLANAPVVWLGDRLAARLNMQLLNRLAAVLFLALGLWTLVPPVRQALL